jgi:hypothetical protein
LAQIILTWEKSLKKAFFQNPLSQKSSNLFRSLKSDSTCFFYMGNISQYDSGEQFKPWACFIFKHEEISFLNMFLAHLS